MNVIDAAVSARRSRRSSTPRRWRPTAWCTAIRGRSSRPRRACTSRRSPTRRRSWRSRTGSTASSPRTPTSPSRGCGRRSSIGVPTVHAHGAMLARRAIVDVGAPHAAGVGRGRRRRGGAGAAQDARGALQRHGRAGRDGARAGGAAAAPSSSASRARSSTWARSSARSPPGSGCRDARRPGVAAHQRRVHGDVGGKGAARARLEAALPDAVRRDRAASSPRARPGSIGGSTCSCACCSSARARGVDDPAMHTRGRVHLRLTGPGGGDFGFVLDGAHRRASCARRRARRRRW